MSDNAAGIRGVLHRMERLGEDGRLAPADSTLACCNETEPEGTLCGGRVTLHGPTYLCDTCGARCGALAHPDCIARRVSVRTTPSQNAESMGVHGRGHEGLPTNADREEWKP